MGDLDYESEGSCSDYGDHGLVSELDSNAAAYTTPIYRDVQSVQQVPGKRAAADFASQMLQVYTTEKVGLMVPDSAILNVLRLWKFKRNQCRPNVTPGGQSTVESDLFGLTRTRTGWYCDTVITRKFAPVARLLNLWLTSRLPFGIMHEPWTWSSITINGGVCMQTSPRWQQRRSLHY